MDRKTANLINKIAEWMISHLIPYAKRKPCIITFYKDSMEINNLFGSPLIVKKPKGVQG